MGACVNGGCGGRYGAEGKGQSQADLENPVQGLDLRTLRS